MPLIAHPTKPAKPYIYGFKTLTPVQSSLFDKTGYQVLESKQENTQSNNQVFQTTQDELLSAAITALKVSVLMRLLCSCWQSSNSVRIWRINGYSVNEKPKEIL
jgi:hypothetical protein